MAKDSKSEKFDPILFYFLLSNAVFFHTDSFSVLVVIVFTRSHPVTIPQAPDFLSYASLSGDCSK